MTSIFAQRSFEMKIRKVFTVILLPCLSFSFTVFVFLNTYEVVMNRQVAFAQSIRKMTNQSVLNNVVTEFGSKPASEDAAKSSSLNNMESLKIPALKTRLELEEARRINGEWYQRPSMGHYIGLNKDSRDTIVDYAIYTSKSWQTIPAPGQLEEGMEVEVNYDGGAISTFTIAEKKVLPLHHSLIVNKAEGRQILLMIEDSANNLYYGYSLELRK